MYNLENLSRKELELMLVLLTEGQYKVNSSKIFEAFQDLKIQKSIIDKVRSKLWDIYYQEKSN